MKRLLILFVFALAMGASYASQARVVAISQAANTSISMHSSNQVTDAIAAAAIHEAAEWGMSNFGMTEAQMLQKYAAGTLKINMVSVAGTTTSVKLTYDGIGISVILDDY